MSIRKIKDDKELLEMFNKGMLQKDIALEMGVSPPAICKRLKRLLPVPESLKALTPKEQRFVVEKASGKTNTDAAMASFDCTSRNSAKALAHNAMNRCDITTAVKEVMQQQGLNRTRRVRKLAEHVDSPDPNVSLKALDQSWKLDAAYTEKHEIVQPSFADIQELLADLRSRQARNLKRLAELEAKRDGTIDQTVHDDNGKN